MSDQLEKVTLFTKEGRLYSSPTRTILTEVVSAISIESDAEPYGDQEYTSYDLSLRPQRAQRLKAVFDMHIQQNKEPLQAFTFLNIVQNNLTLQLAPRPGEYNLSPFGDMENGQPYVLFNRPNELPMLGVLGMDSPDHCVGRFGGEGDLCIFEKKILSLSGLVSYQSPLVFRNDPRFS